KRVGSSTRIGAISPPRPATPNARNVTPPRNVPAAAPGKPFALAAIPVARFSVSNPDSATERMNGEIPRASATPSNPSTNRSAANTTTPTPTTRTMTPTTPDTRAGSGVILPERPAAEVRQAGHTDVRDGECDVIRHRKEVHRRSGEHPSGRP